MRASKKVVFFRSVGGLFLASLLAFPAWSQTQNSRPARPGSVNYVEGQASLDGQPLGANSAGSAEMQKGQTLTTQSGKVEVLLTPGVFLRVGDSSAVKMISPDLANTEVE